MKKSELVEIIREEIKKLMEIRVETDHYKFTHGKMPRGFGTWFFEIGKEKKSFSGKFADASKKAKDYAKEKGITSIKVMT